MNVDGSDLVKLTDYSGIDSCPSWSPDGQKIAFQSLRADPDNTYAIDSIYVMNSDGTGITKLIADGMMPSWSPWLR